MTSALERKVHLEAIEAAVWSTDKVRRMIRLPTGDYTIVGSSPVDTGIRHAKLTNEWMVSLRRRGLAFEGLIVVVVANASDPFTPLDAQLFPS